MKNMKKIIILIAITVSLLLTACSNSDIGIIGGADGPTSIIVAENNADNWTKFVYKNYVNELNLPVLDIHIENPFVSDDRTLVLDDTIENNLELMIYEYYKNSVSGDYSKVKEEIADETLFKATENKEKQFKDGIYFSKIVLDEIELLDREDLEDISAKNRQSIIEKLNNLNVTEFAIIEVEKTVKLNEKYLSVGPQIGDGEHTRYYLLGKKDDKYKIVEVYWEGFIND